MKRLFIIGVAVVLLLCSCNQKTVEPASSASVYENANTVMGRVSYVSGNDFTLAVGEYSGGAAQGALQVVGETPTGEAAGTPTGEEEAPTGGDTTSQQEGNTEPSGRTGAPTGEREAMPSGGTAPEEDNETTRQGERGVAQGAGGAASTQKFVESGEELNLRIPVGTPILYGSLNVDFSQIQTDYIVSVVYHLTDSGSSVRVLSAEILST